MKKFIILLLSLNVYSEFNHFMSNEPIVATAINDNFTLLKRRAFRFYYIYMNETTNGTMLVFNMSLFDKDGNDILNQNSGYVFNVDSNNASPLGASATFDQVNRTETVNWTQYAIQSDNTPPHWLSIDLLTPKTIHGFGASFFPITIQINSGFYKRVMMGSYGLMYGLDSVLMMMSQMVHTLLKKFLLLENTKILFI